MIYGLIIITIIIGTLMPVQAGLNAELGRYLKNPFFGAFISFFTGTILLLSILLFKGMQWEELRRLPSAPIHLLSGGLLGALFVGSSIYLIPRLGATTMIGAFVTGQLLMSVVIDHYGLMSLPVQPASFSRLFGILLLFAGLFLVLKKAA